MINTGRMLRSQVECGGVMKGESSPTFHLMASPRTDLLSPGFGFDIAFYKLHFVLTTLLKRPAFFYQGFCKTLLVFDKALRQ